MLLYWKLTARKDKKQEARPAAVNDIALLQPDTRFARYYLRELVASYRHGMCQGHPRNRSNVTEHVPKSTGWPQEVIS